MTKNRMDLDDFDFVPGSAQKVAVKKVGEDAINEGPEKINLLEKLKKIQGMKTDLIKMFAQDTWNLYQEYIAVGFTREQAFELVLAKEMRTAPRS